MAHTPNVVTLPPDQGLRADGAKLGGWWHRESGSDRIVCDLCPRECVLKAGDRGFCFVRENQGGQMVLTTYGRSTGFSIDPIEKKPLNHFLPGTSVLSFGTAGCNLGCKFCQNWSISKSREVERLSETATPDAIAAACREHGCRSVAFTYNDPIIWAEYAIDVAAACRAVGVKTVAVTAGYITQAARRTFFDAIDAANVDLKAFSEAFYQQYTLSHIQPVLDTLAWLKRETEVWFEITNLVIPRANDSADEFRRMCDWILEHVGDSVPMHFSAFHPDFRMRDRPRTEHATLITARDLARQAGLKYVYVGNVDDRDRQSTRCHRCDSLLIGRNRYALHTWRLAAGACPDCGVRIPGVFEDAPGDWGPRRQRVQISDYQAHRHSSPSKPRNQTVATTSQRASDPDGPLALSDRQREAVRRAACEFVAAAVNGYRPEATDVTLAGAAEFPVVGCFVTLKRKSRLRACCGFLGQRSSLFAGLQRAAVTTATRDVRLPPISPIELAHLTLDVTLLHSRKLLQARGADRIAAIEIGKHGLQIFQGNARGLLLPSVATENGLDAEAFLKQVSLKAGLGPSAWKDDSARLITFEGTSLNGPFAPDVIARFDVARPPRFTQDQVQALARLCKSNLAALVAGAAPMYYSGECPDENVEGLAVSIRIADRDRPLRFGKVSLRPGFALQSTAFELCRSAAGMLHGSGHDSSSVASAEVDVTVLFDPAMHGTVAGPALEGLVTRAGESQQRAILVTESNRSAWCLDPGRSAADLVKAAAEACQSRQPDVARITSLAAVSTTSAVTMVDLPRAVPTTGARGPAVAGRFYPASSDGLQQMIDSLLDGPAVARSQCRAALVPHAGLKYSGRLAADVLRRIEIPETVLVIGPKHTRLGVDWAVAPHARWALPGLTIPSDLALVQALASAIPDLQLDANAHAKEHAIEVELPLIARLAPQAKVVGIAIGTGDLARCQAFGAGLASVLNDRKDVLVLISSDMNHFASDDETRRLDAMALQAIETMNPSEIFQVVRSNHISMCGLLPTVMALDALQRIRPLQNCRRVGYATSADVSGQTDRVVGYAGMIFS